MSQELLDVAAKVREAVMRRFNNMSLEYFKAKHQNSAPELFQMIEEMSTIMEGIVTETFSDCQNLLSKQFYSDDQIGFDFQFHSNDMQCEILYYWETRSSNVQGNSFIFETVPVEAGSFSDALVRFSGERVTINDFSVKELKALMVNLSPHYQSAVNKLTIDYQRIAKDKVLPGIRLPGNAQSPAEKQRAVERLTKKIYYSIRTTKKFCKALGMTIK